MKPDWFNFSEYRSQIKRDASRVIICFVVGFFLIALHFAVEYGVEIDMVCAKYLR